MILEHQLWLLQVLGPVFLSTFILNLFIPIIQIQKIQMLDE